MEVEEEEGRKRRDAVVMSACDGEDERLSRGPQTREWSRYTSYPGAGCDRRIRPYNGSGRRGRVAGQIN